MTSVRTSIINGIPKGTPIPGGWGVGGGTPPLCDLYGEVPLDRVWFLASVLNRVYNLYASLH